MAGKVRHVHSRVTTVLEAARLVRHSIQVVGPSVFTESINCDNMMGACGIASYALARVLRRSGVSCDFVMGRFHERNDRGEHCWVEVPSEDLIVDLTATQFRIPSTVHVTSCEDSRYRPSVRNRKAVEELKDWDSQSHLAYKDVIDTIVADVSIELVQSGFVTVDSR